MVVLELADAAGAPYNAKMTPCVLVACIVAASGGLMYGYDLVIAGGISIMNDFLEKFYPNVLRAKQDTKEDTYCRYNNEIFQLYSSSLYLAALLASVLASPVTRRFGRTKSMLVAGLLFVVGTIFGSAAQNLGMLLSGRALVGCGIGFANQAVPLYLSEIAPPNLRGRLGGLFGLHISIGLFSGNVVNYLAARIHPWGWRLSLGLAGIPALVLTMGGLFLVESPMSLIERGYPEQAKWVLCSIRGTHEVDVEFVDLLESRHIAKEVKTPFRSLLRTCNRPQLVLACAFPLFQQLTGNDAILFYGPFLFKAAGFKDSAALYSAVITGAVSLLSACFALCVVDRAGRRILLLVASIIMSIALTVIAIVFRIGLARNKKGLSHTAGEVELAMLCLFLTAFSVSWGPLTWLIPSEILSQEVRSAGQSVTVCVNMLIKFVIAQTFLSMLCAFKFATFLFFAGWVVVMGLFTLLLVPETKGVALARVGGVWRGHWFWRKVVELHENFDP